MKKKTQVKRSSGAWEAGTVRDWDAREGYRVELHCKECGAARCTDRKHGQRLTKEILPGEAAALLRPVPGVPAHAAQPLDEALRGDAARKHAGGGRGAAQKGGEQQQQPQQQQQQQHE
eukprot:gene1430-5418_t